jgi:hypothetical protein
MTISTDSDLYTLTQRTLRSARDAGPTDKGRKLLREGAALVDGQEFNGLPERCQEDLLALYGQAMLRVSGGLA